MDTQLLHRKHSLILTAIEVIDGLGIQGLSTREIAKRQGVSEATLFRHYKSKNELLVAVLDFYIQYDSDIVKSVGLKNLTPGEAVLYCINALMEYYQSYPEITAIPQVYEILSGDPLYTNKIKEISESRVKVLEQLIIQAKNAGEISKETNSEQLAEIIVGYCRQTILKWRLESYSFSLKERVMSTVTMILNTFK